MFQNRLLSERLFPMPAETAFIPVSLSETLQPPVLGKLVEYAAKEHLSHGQVIARALTQFFQDKEQTPPPLAFVQQAEGGSVKDEVSAAEGRAA